MLSRLPSFLVFLAHKQGTGLLCHCFSHARQAAALLCLFCWEVSVHDRSLLPGYVLRTAFFALSVNPLSQADAGHDEAGGSIDPRQRAALRGVALRKRGSVLNAAIQELQPRDCILTYRSSAIISTIPSVLRNAFQPEVRHRPPSRSYAVAKQHGFPV